LHQNNNLKVKIIVYFNEYDSDKFKSLSKCIEEQRASLQQVEFISSQKDFHHAFDKWKPLMNTKTANLLFLDQSGVQQITQSIFQNIVRLPMTDFIFFISSAIINRFKDQPEIRKYVPANDDDLSSMNGTNVHRILANAYRRWIPEGLQYFLGSFSIKKGANVYGLVFGSSHPLGIDKFLQVAWRRGGDANFDIDKDGIDPVQPSLFSEFDKPTKIAFFEKELEKQLLENHLKTNKDIYLFVLQNGILPAHARDALSTLVKTNKLPKQKFHISYDAWRKLDAETIELFNGDNK
jgi:three-Cys-motif partner protein